MAFNYEVNHFNESLRSSNSILIVNGMDLFIYLFFENDGMGWFSLHFDGLYSALNQNSRKKSERKK